MTDNAIHNTIKLKFYFKCPKCNRKIEGKKIGEWLQFPTICLVCDMKLNPEITVMPTK